MLVVLFFAFCGGGYCLVVLVVVVALSDHEGCICGGGYCNGCRMWYMIVFGATGCGFGCVSGCGVV
jgi:hypothetical protein